MISQPAAKRAFSRAQLSMIRRGVARHCSDPEFDEFIEVAQTIGLDPLRRQIAPFIVSAHDPDARRLIPWATIDGLRILAARQGDYRPMETPPTIECDPALADPDLNPLGIARAEVCAWKRSGDAWAPVAGEAWWSEYAPVRGEENGGGGEARRVLDQSWRRMGRVMIAKCAEAQALRRGWPDVLSGLYGEEELAALRAHERTASERLAAVAAPHDALWFEFSPDIGLESVPYALCFGRLEAFLQGAVNDAQLERFVQANATSMRILWERDPSAAFLFKRRLEARRQALGAGPKAARPRIRVKAGLVHPPVGTEAAG
jgi:phage recombination protein Bet